MAVVVVVVGSTRDWSDGGLSGRVGMSALLLLDAASDAGPRGARRSACCWASRSALGAVGGFGFVGPMSMAWRLSALGPVGIEIGSGGLC